MRILAAVIVLMLAAPALAGSNPSDTVYDGLVLDGMDREDADPERSPAVTILGGAVMLGLFCIWFWGWLGDWRTRRLSSRTAPSSVQSDDPPRPA
jgi:hypothetical protein